MTDQTPAQQLTTAIRAHIGDAKPATDDLLIALAETISSRREHAHPTWEDLFCANLDAWSGERVGVLLRRLVDAIDERDRAREIAVALEQQNARLLAALRAIAALMECGCTTDDCPSHIARAAIQEADRG
jgi:hypothetical protein